MLPILRIIPAGGVLLAIAILVLALNAPGGPHAHFTSAMAPPRGALIAREEHPEWRQFLVLAALRRAEELDKLRQLPDTPLLMQHTNAPAATAKAPDAAKLVGVSPNQADQDDVTGTVQSPDAAIPLDIGESSSTELPVIPHEERPPVIMMPVRETPRPDRSAVPEPVRPKPESRSASPEPAKSRQASRDAAPERIEPNPESPHVAGERVKTRHEVRKKPYPRRARYARAAVKQVEFNLFQAMFGGYNPGRPAANIIPSPPE